ncbi:MAG: DUF2786 domain-containing protein [Dehalococcoidia bacterium]
MIDNARILEKVRRLLALSTSSNEHEAALAAAKAQELLLTYNLELADVPAVQREDVTQEVLNTGNTASWVGVLLGSVARHNFGDAIYLGDGQRAIIAQPHNIEVIKYLYDYLVREINRLADRGWASFDGYASSARRWKTGFRFGAISAIDARLEAERRKAQQASVDTRALIVTSDEAVRAAVHRYYPQLRTRKVGGGDLGGYGAGRAAGASVDIRPAVGGSSSGGSLLR